MRAVSALRVLVFISALVHVSAKVHGSSDSVRHGHIQKKRSPPSDKNVIIQMFEWDWDSIAYECAEFIGPAGYGYVQGKCYIPIVMSCSHSDAVLSLLLQ